MPDDIEPGADERFDDHRLQTELATLLNRRSRENASNTPDFILAAVMMAALKAFEGSVTARDTWYGLQPSPGMSARRALVEDDGLKYRIWSQEHAAWWRPNHGGYTTVLDEAGAYSRPEALGIIAQAALCADPTQAEIMVVIPGRL